MDFFVAIDAGTGSGKCFVFDRNGTLRGNAAEPWSYEIRADPEIPSVKWFSFDPRAFWSTLCRCLRAALDRAHIQPSQVAGVAATSQREACVFLGPDGQEVYAGPNLDSRGFREGLEILAEIGAERLYTITGHSAPFIFPLARYLWFRKHGGRSVSRLLMMNDWILWRLSGECFSEPSNATESMLFDVAQRQWSAEILDTFAMPSAILPPIRQPGERAGSVQPEVAAATGLLPGTPVYIGGADTQCSLLGAGAIEAGDVGATLGTTTPVQAVLDHLALDPAGRLWAGCHVVPNRWVLESNAGDTGDAYLWLVDLLRSPDEPPQVARQRLEAAAAACGDSSAWLFVGPSVFELDRIALRRPGGILFPYPTLHVRPSAGQIVRGFFESVGFALRANLEQLCTALPEVPQRLVASGGMTRNATLVQVLADATARTVHVANEAESAALGCAMLIASEGRAEELRRLADTWVHYRSIPPGPEHPRYEPRYRTWRRLYEHLFDLEV